MKTFYTSSERQQLTCARHSLPCQAPEEHVAVALGSLAGSPIYGTRIVLGENDTTSWFIHCGEHSADLDFYQAVHTCHLHELLPEVVDYLCLPPGSCFIIDREGYEDVWRQHE